MLHSLNDQPIRGSMIFWIFCRLRLEGRNSRRYPNMRSS
ncbi:hypothetical protein LT85_0526 [Collimonas arenae]|uniref:Uncharacterized protein n=1 Tax=Collimonas arenae TaxID=279058 RepID=A0A0A1F577_9BURK|nr:hypothetical protein LT85_0526 [Collimonas arenae]